MGNYSGIASQGEKAIESYLYLLRLAFQVRTDQSDPFPQYHAHGILLIHLVLLRKILGA